MIPGSTSSTSSASQARARTPTSSGGDNDTDSSSCQAHGTPSRLRRIGTMLARRAHFGGHKATLDLMSFPREIRDRIYELYLREQNEEPHLRIFGPVPPPGLLRAGSPARTDRSTTSTSTSSSSSSLLFPPLRRAQAAGVRLYHRLTPSCFRPKLPPMDLQKRATTLFLVSKTIHAESKAILFLIAIVESVPLALRLSHTLFKLSHPTLPYPTYQPEMSLFLAPRSTHFVHIRHLNIFVTPHVIPDLTKVLEATEQDPRDAAMITAKRFVRFRVVHPRDLALHRTWFEPLRYVVTHMLNLTRLVLDMTHMQWPSSVAATYPILRNPDPALVPAASVVRLFMKVVSKLKKERAFLLTAASGIADGMVNLSGRTRHRGDPDVRRGMWNGLRDAVRDDPDSAGDRKVLTVTYLLTDEQIEELQTPSSSAAAGGGGGGDASSSSPSNREGVPDVQVVTHRDPHFVEQWGYRN
ncbi:hypothetical protein BU24DRAFT_451042 [Aaosphaeria arxii CBS 175.79]|uniref:Uncharacterized protein n=1 Tax=Aaosphaeria arxii CBS 175.79 TaxID=1450172 RepID=A0A6A5XTC7_9PLEO|nr:uncharacterized protein BU24DRAFT_451042 [Aaosphaeria arxii CBS 175.79]KAF2016538.1 hypothetical protein BU24DRAFT_451042 [Aaosphaeria arxii CBS 175.79]